MTIDKSCLIRINNVDSARKLICMHSVTGQTRRYSELAEHLVDIEVFCFEARGMRGETAQPESVKEILEDYLPQLLAVQPSGPFCLAGYSSGGILAFELAQALKETGHEVGLLALIDAGIRTERMAPLLSYDDYLDRSLWKIYTSVVLENVAYLMGYRLLDPRIYHLEHPFWNLPEDVRMARLCELLPAHGRTEAWRRTPPKEIEIYFRFMKTLWHLLQDHVRDHKIKRYAGDVTYFEPVDTNDPFSGSSWQDLTAGKFSRIRVPGDHISVLTSSNCQFLATEISRLIKTAYQASVPI